MFGAVVACLGGCAGTSTVPEVDASKLRVPAFAWLEPKQVRLDVVDERFVPAEDKQKSIGNVKAAVSAALAGAGIAVAPDSENALFLRFGEGDRPIGEFASNECVMMTAVLRTSRHRQVEASGLNGDVVTVKLRGNTTTAFEIAINSVFGELVRLSS